MGKWKKNTRKHNTQEGQKVSPIPAGDSKAARNKQDKDKPGISLPFWSQGQGPVEFEEKAFGPSKLGNLDAV